MNYEYGIACLLDEHSIKNLQRDIPFIDRNNIPHISLFQFRCTDGRFFSLIRKILYKLSISTFFATLNISFVENYIFLDITDDSSLKSSSDQLAEFYAINCSRREILTQISLNKLKKDQINLVNKYGIYWVKQYFRPHVTLSYEHGYKGNLNLAIPKAIKVTKPNIYPIDKEGRILHNLI